MDACEADRRLRDPDPEVASLAHLGQNVGGAQDGFGGNACDVGAAASDRPFSTTAVFRPSCAARIA